MTVLQGQTTSVAAKEAEPIWFASYPAGVPRTIDPDAFPSLATMLIDACRQHAARPAFESLGARMSYAEWGRDSKDFAGFLIEQVGCRAIPHRSTGWRHGALLLMAMLCTACIVLSASEAGAQCSARDALR